MEANNTPENLLQDYTIPEPLKLISIKDKLMPYCTPNARIVLNKRYENTVLEYNLDTGREIDYNKILAPMKDGSESSVQQNRGASICQYIAIEARCKFGERATKDIDSVVAFQLAGLLNQLVKEDYVHKFVFQDTPVSIELTLLDEKNEMMVGRNGRGKWVPFPDNTNTPYGPIMQIADLTRLQEETSITYDPTIGKEIELLERRLQKWNKRYTEEEVLNLTYRKMYMMGVYFTEKFDEEVRKKVGTQYHETITHYHDYNRFLGRDWIVLEGGLPTVVITL